MKIVTQFRVLLGRAYLVGSDSAGNTYYQYKKRRWVLYNGLEDGSKIPPLWHAWLHHTMDEVPMAETLYAWQKPHLPNLTGTPEAYTPKPRQTAAAYTAWQPDHLRSWKEDAKELG